MADGKGVEDSISEDQQLYLGALAEDEINSEVASFFASDLPVVLEDLIANGESGGVSPFRILTPTLLLDCISQLHALDLVEVYFFLRKFVTHTLNLDTYLRKHDPDLASLPKPDIPTRYTQAKVGTLRPHEIKEFLAEHGVSTMEEYKKQMEGGQTAPIEVEEPDPQATAVYDLAHAGPHGQQGYRESSRVLMQSLSLIGIVIGTDAKSRLVLYSSGKLMNYLQVARLTMDLENVFDIPKIFNYKLVIEQTLAACTEVLATRCPQFPRLAEAMAEVTVTTNAVSGEDFMVQYEVAFETNMAQKRITFPDPAQLTPAHIELMRDIFQATTSGHFRLLFFLACSRIMCHEVIHCIQHLAEQQDSDPVSWSAEHDASYVCHSLFWAVSRLGRYRELFRPGLAHEVLDSADNLAARKLSTWSGQTIDEYCKWRNSFGLESPAQFVRDTVGLTPGFKLMIACEGKNLTEEALQRQLDQLFKDRRGEVHQKPTAPQWDLYSFFAPPPLTDKTPTSTAPAPGAAPAESAQQPLDKPADTPTSGNGDQEHTGSMLTDWKAWVGGAATLFLLYKLIKK